jgi:hypothetical protein
MEVAVYLVLLVVMVLTEQLTLELAVAVHNTHLTLVEQADQAL